MEEKSVSISDILEKLQFNEKEEAQAIIDYTRLIADLNNINVDEAIKIELVAEIEEIIRDELNHQEKLFAMYVGLSGITPNKD